MVGEKEKREEEERKKEETEETEGEEKEGKEEEQEENKSCSFPNTSKTNRKEKNTLSPMKDFLSPYRFSSLPT